MAQEGQAPKVTRWVLAPMLIGHLTVWASAFAVMAALGCLAQAAMAERAALKVLGVVLFVVMLGLTAWLVHNLLRLPDWTARVSLPKWLTIAGWVGRGIGAAAAAAWAVGVVVLIIRVLGRRKTAVIAGTPYLVVFFVCLVPVAVYALCRWREFVLLPDWWASSGRPVGLSLLGQIGSIGGAVDVVGGATMLVFLMSLPDAEALGGALQVIGVINAALSIVIGAALLERRPWSRRGAIVLCAANAIVALALLVLDLAWWKVWGPLGWLIAALVGWCALLAFLLYYFRRPNVAAVFEAEAAVSRAPSAPQAIGRVGLWLSVGGLLACVALFLLGAASGEDGSGAKVLSALLFGLVSVLGIRAFRQFVELPDWELAPDVPLGLKLIGHLARAVGSLSAATCVAMLVVSVVLSELARPGLAAMFGLGIFISLLVGLLGSGVSELRHWARPASLIASGLAVALVVVALIFNLTRWQVEAAAAPLWISLGGCAVLFLFLLVYFMLPPVVAAFKAHRL